VYTVKKTYKHSGVLYLKKRIEVGKRPFSSCSQPLQNKSKPPNIPPFWTSLFFPSTLFVRFWGLIGRDWVSVVPLSPCKLAYIGFQFAFVLGQKIVVNSSRGDLFRREFSALRLNAAQNLQVQSFKLTFQYPSLHG